MGTTHIQVELPKELYDRLEAAAENKKVDPITLIETWLKAMEQSGKAESGHEPSSAPIYQVHNHAVDMGVDDLAQNLDHYLYGHPKNENGS